MRALLAAVRRAFARLLRWLTAVHVDAKLHTDPVFTALDEELDTWYSLL